MCGLLLVFSAFAVVSLPVRSFRLDVRAARAVTRASSQKSKIFNIFPSHRAIAPRHPPRTRRIDARDFPRGITARAPTYSRRARRHASR